MATLRCAEIEANDESNYRRDDFHARIKNDLARGLGAGGTGFGSKRIDDDG